MGAKPCKTPFLDEKTKKIHVFDKKVAKIFGGIKNNAYLCTAFER